jgi:hypothetical protein
MALCRSERFESSEDQKEKTSSLKLFYLAFLIFPLRLDPNG